MANTTDGIRWGIIGCGNVTEKKSGPAFNKVPDSSLVAVMRRNGDKARDYAARHGVPKWYDDADQLINDPEVNAVYVATPPGSHEACALAAIAAGKPVYVEKPMSVDVASCRRMQAAANSAGVKLSIAHYRRALPKFLAIQKMLAEKAIGDVRLVSLRMLQPDQSGMITQTADNWRVNPAEAGAGLFYDLAPHQLDIILFYFGAPKAYQGFAVNQAGLYAAEDAVIGQMLLPGNILFSGQWCYTVAEGLAEDYCEITGSAGSLRFSIFGHEIQITKGNDVQTETFTPPEHIQQPMIAQVVQYFMGRGSNPCSAADALQSMQVMEQFAYGETLKK